MIGELTKHQHALNLTEPVDFIFDRGNDERVTQGWDSFVASAPEETKRWLGQKPCFGNDEAMMPLQAADLLAWWRRRSFEAKFNPSLKTRKPPWSKQSGLLYLEMEWTEKRIQTAYDLLYERSD